MKLQEKHIDEIIVLKEVDKLDIIALDQIRGGFASCVCNSGSTLVITCQCKDDCICNNVSTYTETCSCNTTPNTYDTKPVKPDLDKDPIAHFG